MSANVEEILGEAAKLEKEYEWLQASELYKQTLGMVDDEDHFRRGEIQEKIGYSLRRAAFQAESPEEFREKMLRAVEAYERAHDLYEKLADGRGAPWMLRCRAISKDLSHWLASDPSEKRRLLDECLELEEEALTAFWDLGNKVEYGRTYNELPHVSWHRVHREWDRQVRRRILEKAIAWGEKAAAVLSEPADQNEIARANYTLALHLNCFYIWFVAEPEKQEQHRLKNIERLHKAVEFSEKVGDAYTAGLSLIRLGLETGGQESTRHFKKALECGEETRDIYLKAVAQDFIAFRTYWIAFAIDDPDQRLKLAEEAMEFYDKAQHHFSIMSYLHPRIGIILAPGGYAEHYYIRASQWETDPEKKLDLLKKSEKAGLKALKAAEDLDIPQVIDRMCHYLSKTLTALAKLEPDVDVKKSLLEKAMKHRERNIEIEERLDPFHYWNIGVWCDYLALIKAELADVELDLKDKRRLLEDAALSMEKGLNSINKIMPYREKRGEITRFARLSRFQDGYEVILTRLYEVTNEREHLRKAIEISWKSIESASKVDMVSRIAESYWKIAKTQDILGEHLEAAENFQLASESYMKAAQKIPQLKEFYQEYSTYMQAWSEIENARHHHKEKRYGEAKKHYEKAAELHEATERWGYLSPNYLAWARVEEAEDLSRREQTQEARDLFQQAAKLFGEAQESIRTKVSTIEAGEERQVAEELIKVSDVRCEYCLGRVALEEARILDRQGDHSASSKRYSQAVERFQEIMSSLESESDKNELLPIISLCKAWAKMMMAETQISSSLFNEAAELFLEARENASDQTTRLLAQAHSSFCKALEAGTKFEITRDTRLFSEAKRHIEAATSHYLRAGHHSSSDFATATNRLLDGYMYTYNGQTEMDPDRKARFYQMAERLLQDSAGLFLKAKHPEKSDEVRTILKNIRGEKEIALSLAQLMHAPTIMQTTSSFSTPTPTHEQAVGLERFENADIQANLIARKTEVGVGEDLDLEIELVNAGKGPAQLIKISGIIPEGFEVVSISDNYSVEDGTLDLRGRSLPSLKVETVKLVLKTLSSGSFTVKPRVLYLDEASKLKSLDLDSLSFEVTELRMPEKGGSYLYASHERCFKDYVSLTEGDVAGFAIVRGDPEKLVEEYGLKPGEVYLLSSRGLRGFEALSDLQAVSREISRRLEAGVGVILLDGVEYLVAQFGFDAVYSFIQEKRFDFLRSKAVLLVPLEMKTLNEQERALLSSEFTL